jgi:hypothetical protein
MIIFLFYKSNEATLHIFFLVFYEQFHGNLTDEVHQSEKSVKSHKTEFLVSFFEIFVEKNCSFIIFNVNLKFFFRQSAIYCF